MGSAGLNVLMPWKHLAQNEWRKRGKEREGVHGHRPALFGAEWETVLAFQAARRKEAGRPWQRSGVPASAPRPVSSQSPLFSQPAKGASGPSLPGNCPEM